MNADSSNLMCLKRHWHIFNEASVEEAPARAAFVSSLAWNLDKQKTLVHK